MKKVYILILFALVLCSCSLKKEEPRDIVLNYFSNYNKLDKKVLDSISDSLKKSNYSSDNNKLYEKVLKRQYKNLKYTILDSEVYDSKAVVTVNIEVYDYNKIINESVNNLIKNLDEYYNENNEFDNNKFDTLKLNMMINTNERINYEIIFYLEKNNSNWTLVKLSEDDISKINGLYK